MRQIEKRMVSAVMNGRSFKSGNTVVTADTTGVKVFLHGNCIFAVYQGVKRFTLAGWNSVTTRSRLNALGVAVSQKNWAPMYKGSVINSRAWYVIQ